MRSTPLQNGFSPLQQLMNHHLCTNFPITEAQLQPQISKFTIVKEEQRGKQKKVFDTRQAARDLDPLLPGEEVWVRDHNTSGRVMEPIVP